MLLSYLRNHFLIAFFHMLRNTPTYVHYFLADFLTQDLTKKGKSTFPVVACRRESQVLKIRSAMFKTISNMQKKIGQGAHHL